MKIFHNNVLEHDAVIRKFRITAGDGKSYNTNHYSLEIIIAVGFRKLQIFIGRGKSVTTGDTIELDKLYIVELAVKKVGEV